MEEAARVLLVPIFRRHWLWYAWGGRTAAAAVEAGRAAAAAVKPPRDWRQGVNLEEKAHLLSQLARSWVSLKQTVCAGAGASSVAKQDTAKLCS